MSLFTWLGALALAQSPMASPPALEAPSPPPELAAPAVARLAALTPLRLRIEGDVSSKTHVAGDRIVIILAEALPVTETLAIPAGTRGVGEVIHSAKKGMGGKPGELLIAARSLDVAPGISVPLRSFRLAPAKGKNQEGVAAGLAVAGGAVGSIAALIVTGGSALVPDGSEAFAKTASDVELPIAVLVPLVGAGPSSTPAAPLNPTIH